MPPRKPSQTSNAPRSPPKTRKSRKRAQSSTDPTAEPPKKKVTAEAGEEMEDSGNGPVRAPKAKPKPRKKVYVLLLKNNAIILIIYFLVLLFLGIRPKSRQFIFLFLIEVLHC